MFSKRVKDMIFTPWSLVEAAKKVWGRRRRRKDRENHCSMTKDT